MTIDVSKTGYFVVAADFPEGVVGASKTGYWVIAAPEDGANLTAYNAYMLSEQIFDTRIFTYNAYMANIASERASLLAFNAYLIIRPTPIHNARLPQMIVNIGGRGGGGPILPPEPEPLVGLLSQSQTLSGSLSVATPEPEAKELAGSVSQTQTVAGKLGIVQNLSGTVTQTQTLDGNLYAGEEFVQLLSSDDELEGVEAQLLTGETGKQLLSGDTDD